MTRVEVCTAAGAIVIELDLDRAPHSAGQFLQFVQQGRFTGGRFWRAVRTDNDRGTPPIQVLQAAAADDLAAGITPVPHEPTSHSGLRHEDGTLSLARAEPGTASAAAFFICIGTQPGLDAGALRNADGLGFAAFGRVVHGMDIVRAIHSGATTDDAPVEYIRGQLLARPVVFLSAAVQAGPWESE